MRGFRSYFTPLTGVLFTFRSRYCALSVAEEYLALGGGPPGFRPGFTCPTVLGWSFERVVAFRVRGYHPLRHSFPEVSARLDLCDSRRRPKTPGTTPTTPHAQRFGPCMHAVWALSRSLAATEDIDGSFCSWGY
jgi:hypothetical protein